MAIAVQKQEFVVNSGGLFSIDLDLADVGTDRFMLVWESRIVWNITGSIARVHLLDGVVETEFTRLYDTGNNINPRNIVWVLSDPPSKVDAGAKVVVTLTGADKRIIVGGYNLSGVDLPAAIGPFTSANDQSFSTDRSLLDADPAAAAGAFFDMVGINRLSGQPKLDFSPLTAGLVELYDSPAFPGSVFYGTAAGMLANGAVITELSWLLSTSPDVAWNHSALQLVQIVVPPRQSLTLKAPDRQSLTLKEV